MATEGKKLTFAVTPETKLLLNAAKEEFFCDGSQSDMLRSLVLAGLRAVESRKTPADASDGKKL